MSEQSSATHGRNEDDALKREARSELQAHGEWPDPADQDEEEPEATWAVEGRFDGDQHGEDWQAISLRSELARHLGRTAFPATRDQLMEILATGQAPQRLLELVSALPAGGILSSLSALLTALDLPVEERPAGGH